MWDIVIRYDDKQPCSLREESELWSNLIETGRLCYPEPRLAQILPSPLQARRSLWYSSNEDF